MATFMLLSFCDDFFVLLNGLLLKMFLVIAFVSFERRRVQPQNTIVAGVTLPHGLKRRACGKQEVSRERKISQRTKIAARTGSRNQLLERLNGNDDFNIIKLENNQFSIPRGSSIIFSGVPKGGQE